MIVMLPESCNDITISSEALLAYGVATFIAFCIGAITERDKSTDMKVCTGIMAAMLWPCILVVLTIKALTNIITRK